MKGRKCLIMVVAAVLLLGSSCAGLHIASLEADAEWTVPGSGIKVTCIASGPDEGELSYEWSATGGSINGTGSQVTWVAPEEVGMYDITVTVIDTQGRRDRSSITLIASNGPPPVIHELIVTADHKYLKETTSGYKVGKAYNYSIECVASSTTGEMVYEWSCTGGTISGGGSVITWTAPNSEGDVTVTAKVFDALSNWVRKSVALEVVACSDCTFP